MNLPGVLPGGWLAWFGLAFFGGGMLASWIYFWGLADWWSARTWAETPCRIVEAELRESRDSDSTSYRAVGRYVYLWEGREYDSDWISLVGGSDNLGDYQQRVHRQMEQAMREREGASICYVNPRDPGMSVMVRELRPSQMALMSLFALVFPMIGAFASYGGWVAEKKQKNKARLRMEYPDKPWRWNAAWNVSPTAESGWHVGGVMLFAGAAWWAMVTVPLLAAGMVDGIFTRPAGFWLLIPGVFLAAAMWMVLNRIRQRSRIGMTWLDMSLPIQPGRDHSGAWITSKPLRTHDRPILKIICMRTVTTESGGETSTKTEAVWEHEASLNPLEQTREVSAFRLPFRFCLPVDVKATTLDEEATIFSWKLRFRIPGSAVKSTFDVPVCR